MKKYLLIIAAVMMMFSCKKETPVTPTITLSSPAEETFDTDGGIKTVSFTSNVAWTASIDNKSFSITPSSGEAGTVSIKVTALQNESNDPVTAKLTITAQSAKQDVKFTQLQKNALSVETLMWSGDCSEHIVDVKVTANVDYKVTSSESWIKAEKKETKGLVESYITISVEANKGDERAGVVVVSGGGIDIEIGLIQDKFEPVFDIIGTDENGYLYLGQEGGEASFIINTNVNYTLKKYDGPEEAFPWAPVTVDGGNVTFKASANNAYGSRTAYVKITSSEIQVPVLDPAGEPTGETEDLVVRIYLAQEGLKYVKYSLSMYDMQFDTWGTTVLSEAIYNGKHYVSNGQDLYEIDPATGKYAKKDWFCGNGMTQKVITNDDAGNLIVCNHTAYNGEAYTDGYFILNAVKPDGSESNLITKAAYECGGPFGARIVVKGNVFGDAVIVAPVEGIADITMSNTIGCFEVKSGVASPYTTVSVSGIAGTWACACWHTYPNNFPTIIAKGITASNGFLMTGCYEDNKYYNIAADGSASPLLLPDPEQDGNYAYQSMDIISLGMKSYIVSVASTHFPAWGLTPVVSLIDMDDVQGGEIIHNVAKFNMNGTSYFAPDWDYGISVAADVKLYDAGNGNVGIFFTDLNGRSVETYEINPAL